MGQIIKPVCVCQCICVSVCAHSRGRISWSIFTKIGTDVRTPISKNEFVGVYIAPPLPLFFCPLKTSISGQEVLKVHANIKNLISDLNVRESPKFSCLIGNRGRPSRNRMVTSDFRPEVEIWPYRACTIKNMHCNPYLMAKSPNFYRNSSVIVDLAMGQIPRSTERTFLVWL